MFKCNPLDRHPIGTEVLPPPPKKQTTTTKKEKKFSFTQFALDISTAIVLVTPLYLCMLSATLTSGTSIKQYFIAIECLLYIVQRYLYKQHIVYYNQTKCACYLSLSLQEPLFFSMLLNLSLIKFMD